MKIIRTKKINAYPEKDMFALLCLVQSVAVILIVFILFAFTKVNGEALSDVRQDLSVIFGTDLDMGGYFTPSEERATQAPLQSDASQEAAYSEPSVLTVSAESGLTVMPVTGTVTSPYGYREHPVYSGQSFHAGTDIAAAEGSAVYAVTDGVVTSSSEAEMAGKYVKILHPDGRETLYCHCSSLLVTEGQKVKAGDVIALVGQTGLATGPHLHFELHENGEAVDPDKILSGAVNVC